MNFEQQYSQQQKQVQKMAMTQQLQQSIQMLQFNREDLISFLNQKALGNPLIEVNVERDRAGEVSLPSSSSATVSASNSNEEQDRLSFIPDTKTSLFAFVVEQIHLTMRNTFLRDLVLLLAEHLDDNGYIGISLEEAEKLTGAQTIQLLDALTLLQQLDPPGVGARNLQECLMLQTERDDQAPNLAYVILEEEFENFANRKWKVIAEKYAIALSEVQAISDYVQTLTPNPGAFYDGEPEQYIRPDLVVKIEDKRLLVQSVKSGMPVLSFQQDYYEQMLRVQDKDVTRFIKEKHTEYDWLKRSLQQRGETIVKVGTMIVERQKDFFLQPDHPIHPLMLKEVATELGIHESTVSRSVNGKYLETPFGVFELKHFFTNSLSVKKPSGNDSTTANDESISAENVKKKIQYLIEEENKQKPLSDQKIADLLTKSGIEISRRTVTKYREALSIPTSSKRKRYE